MAYKHMNAYINNTPTSLKDQYVEQFGQLMNDQFLNASDVFTIEEEYPFASEEYHEITVRINHVIDSDTGEKRGDDYKKILFKELDHFTQPGQQYRFDDNIWITYNTESIKSLTSDALVTRCNNTLRWIGNDGGLYEMPCSITEIIKQTRDYSTAGSSLVIPAGFFEILCQFNEKSNKIKHNQRFLFGNPDNWLAFRVHGAGVQNYKNLKTYDNMSPGIIRLIVGANFINEQTDDLERGIADFVESVYSVSINNQNVVGNVGKKIQLTSTVTFNGSTVTRPITWSTDNEQVAKVDSNGMLTLIGVGACEILCSLENNGAVFDTIIVNVSGSPVLDYEIIITPNVNYILKGVTKTFDVRLWLNGVVQSDTFTFSLDSNTIPITNYTYTPLTGNTFSIKNIKAFLTDTLDITCTSGSNSKTMSILLREVF